MTDGGFTVYIELEGYEEMDCCKEAALQRAKVRVWAVIGFSLGVLTLALVLALGSLIWASYAHAGGTPWHLATVLPAPDDDYVIRVPADTSIECVNSIDCSTPELPAPPENLREVHPDEVDPWEDDDCE